jgi:UDP-glucose 4-epimerase
MGMRVAVIGATGNAGTSVVKALAGDPEVESVVGIARRCPPMPITGVEWRTADILGPDLPRRLEGADAVVHLAWLIQPSHDEPAMRAVNVDGSARVFAAAADAGVSALVYASSVGAYSEGPKDRAVDESWPTEGIETSFYAQHKAEVERLLDAHEREHPAMRVVRLRPGLLFKREAATEIRRLFLGPLMPNRLLSRRLLAAVPAIERLRFQAVHTDDVAEAYRLAVIGDASGPFNVAAEPVLDPPHLAEALDARPVEVPPAALRGAAAFSWRARLQPTHEGWLDMALAVPIMDTTRAREELGWTARRSSVDALLELLDGLREGAGYPTPPLDPASSGRFRIGEFRTGVGARAF